MIPRALQGRVERLLADFPAVALLGPRQVGKTTLARAIAAGAPATEYLDLENPAHRARLDDAGAYLRSRADRLIVIDEVQRAPGLFAILRGIIDDGTARDGGTGRFLLLGSASLVLLQQSSESLAGRIAFVELQPFDMREMRPEDQDRLWVRGGFPRSFLAESDAASATWRAQFIATYLERDIPQLGPRIAAETLRRFWTMLAHAQGGLLNAAHLARSLGVDGKTVARYVDLLVDLLLVRRLTPLHANVRKRLVKSPKIYVRDSGLVHTLLMLDTFDQLLGHPVAGTSWEGFVIESLLAAAPPRTEPSFFRTAAGAEVDLVLTLPGGRRWAIEIKRSSAPRPSRGFHVALGDIGPDRAYLLYPGKDRYPKGNGIEAIGLHSLIEELSESAPAV